MQYTCDDLMSVQELQELLGIGKSSAYRLLESHELKGIRVGKLWKVPKSAVEDYVQAQLAAN